MELPYPIRQVKFVEDLMKDSTSIVFILDNGQKLEFIVHNELFQSDDYPAHVLMHMHEQCLTHWEKSFAPEKPEHKPIWDLHDTDTKISAHDYFAETDYMLFWSKIKASRKFDWFQWLKATNYGTEKIAYKESPSSSFGGTVSSTMRKLLPGLSKRATCPLCESYGTLQAMIIHLNDFHRTSREEMADWLETLDIDLRFKENNG